MFGIILDGGIWTRIKLKFDDSLINDMQKMKWPGMLK